MPITAIEEQQRAVEAGRIRTGIQVRTAKGGKRPEKLETFRFTSRNQAVIVQAATLFGGTPREITEDRLAGQWEVISEASTIPIVVPNTKSVSQWYERWSAQGCIRRCDGQTSTLRGVSRACDCPADRFDRQALAARGDACKATTRVAVIIPDLQGLGVWRVESHGWNAAVEMAQVATALGVAAERGTFLPAVLRLDPREDRIPRDDGPPDVNRYMVPVIEILTSLRELTEGTDRAALLPPAPPPRAIGAGPTPAQRPPSTPPAGTPRPPTGPPPRTPHREAQDIVRDVPAVTTIPALKALWDEAERGGMLTAMVTNPVDEYEIVELRDVINDRHRTLTGSAQ